MLTTSTLKMLKHVIRLDLEGLGSLSDAADVSFAAKDSNNVFQESLKDIFPLHFKLSNNGRNKGNQH